MTSANDEIQWCKGGGSIGSGSAGTGRLGF
ncbi:hypothetical protein ABIC28_001417 [Rhodococcus sp. PvR044]|nr:hypothetical protein [Rhodococcus sp. PvR099]